MQGLVGMNKTMRFECTTAVSLVFLAGFAAAAPSHAQDAALAKSKRVSTENAAPTQLQTVTIEG